ncbi:palmitoyl-monogalactosyldiacylglycerol delta-7 desaturase, chloroplastic-like isoform X2 [Macadamia integrifolia]|uniref:palmitoyl-monogalactosyldiacylglycerol delta-7 desaturase, chloroplastic-like isoform X2 n=1 Tax=Macadamia integrifolia TaxID=60698 RepID=UPI001C4F91D0|nr:palmitoyl-monogalactosyldiacylglycerol delta-7 desaturase, chloroplastic-like isoform X2 [Macadamia integrifolia]
MALLASPPNAGFNPSSPIVRTKRSPRLGSSVLNAAGVESSEQNPLISETSSRKRRGAVGVARAVASENLGGGHQILLSDVVVKQGRRVYLGRKWNSLDMATAGVVLFMHLLCLFALFTFNWRAFWVAVSLYVLTGLFGITLSFHRNLTHRSFKIPRWLEYFFAYCGVQALRCGEPNNVADLQKQPFYRFLRSTYIAHPIALGALLYALGGFPFFVWGMGVRIVWVYHITWLVNSACHVWGRQAWNTGDLSRNNWWVALLAFGEGWHNNHHAFEYSARHGLDWWELDMTWCVVRLLQAVGLATDVKVPSETHKQRMAFHN